MVMVMAMAMAMVMVIVMVMVMVMVIVMVMVMMMVMVTYRSEIIQQYSKEKLLCFLDSSISQLHSAIIQINSPRVLKD